MSERTHLNHTTLVLVWVAVAVVFLLFCFCYFRHLKANQANGQEPPYEIRIEAENPKVNGRDTYTSAATPAGQYVAAYKPPPRESHAVTINPIADVMEPSAQSNVNHNHAVVSGGESSVGAGKCYIGAT
ncbi:unnamed protein product [Aphanomyces euteiches]|uniref:Uncharacterized protein n=1 Tax=Aphanomyces euteiches TaxID=100861 RepID=A0A6G0X7C0_9STRA|nr:hypothetical protein Ae201684_007798 [Aphanomyces euteiches]KAH9067383.1 hypothetical protein Ae201684P_021542 [Aphanomyces euteiches]KAH9145905.1 hypothetical protein AeRB84_010207 [Aphanomyces euteiches]